MDIGALGRRTRSRRGQSLVEFAVVLPVLALMFGGVVDLGRAFYYEVSVTDAARDGARVLVGNSQGNGPGLTAVCTALARDLSNLGGLPAASCVQSGHPPPYVAGTDYTRPVSGSTAAVIYCGSWSQPSVGGSPCVSAPRAGCATQAQCPNQVAVYVYYGYPLMMGMIEALTGSAAIQLQNGTEIASAW